MIWGEWRREFSSSVCSLMEPQLCGSICGDVLRVDCNMDKHSCISGWTEHGVYIFFALEKFDFFFFFCIFHYAIYWMKLERFFSMLAPTQPQLCLRLSSKNKDWGISTSAGTSGYFIFLFVPSLLPTVMDPSSVIIRFLFFCTFTKHLVIVMQLWISAK